MTKSCLLLETPLLEGEEAPYCKSVLFKGGITYRFVQSLLYNNRHRYPSVELLRDEAIEINRGNTPVGNTRATRHLPANTVESMVERVWECRGWTPSVRINGSGRAEKASRYRLSVGERTFSVVRGILSEIPVDWSCYRAAKEVSSRTGMSLSQSKRLVSKALCRPKVGVNGSVATLRQSTYRRALGERTLFEVEEMYKSLPPGRTRYWYTKRICEMTGWSRSWVNKLLKRIMTGEDTKVREWSEREDRHLEMRCEVDDLPTMAKDLRRRVDTVRERCVALVLPYRELGKSRLVIPTAPEVSEEELDSFLSAL